MKKVLVVLLMMICLSYNLSVFALEDDVLPPIDPDNYDVYEGEINPVGDIDSSKGKVSVKKIIVYSSIIIIVASGGVYLLLKNKNIKNREINNDDLIVE